MYWTHCDMFVIGFPLLQLNVKSHINNHSYCFDVIQCEILLEITGLVLYFLKEINTFIQLGCIKEIESDR